MSITEVIIGKADPAKPFGFYYSNENEKKSGNFQQKQIFFIISLQKTSQRKQQRSLRFSVLPETSELTVTSYSFDQSEYLNFLVLRNMHFEDV